jgi:gliding motility-associated-like protein
LEIVPYPGLGCLDTLSSVIKLSPEGFNFSVVDSLAGCISNGVDLTAKSITAGSTPGLAFSYFLDENQRNYLPTPKVVTTSGVYYIKAVNSTGCNEMRPVKTTMKDPPNIVVTNPAPVCLPNAVDLTVPAITAGSEANLTYTYWKDAAATSSLINPKAITTSGTYYINGSFTVGCSKTVAVAATVGAAPVLSVINPSDCGKVDLSTSSITAGSDAGLTYSYWQDAAASLSLPSSTVTTTGDYYIKGTTSLGCATIKPVHATVNAFPSFTVASPLNVTYPAAADLTAAMTPRGAFNYSFWRDAQTTVPLTRPNSINFNGTFYIKGKNEFGCSVNKPVIVIIDAPPEPKITAPTAFSPNKDGINDLFKISIVEGEVDINHVSIFNRWGQAVFNAKTLNNLWDGTTNGKPLPTGIYYWIIEGTDKFKEKKIVSTGSITLLR